MKILFIHNIIAPYRTPLFEELAKLYDIHVIFLEKNDSSRKWEQDSSKLRFRHSFLESKTFKLFGKNVTINYGLKKKFKEINPDILVTLDNPKNFLTVINSINLAKHYKLPIILWTGAFDSYLTNNTGIKKFLINFSISKIRKFIYNRSDFFWAYSIETKNYLRNNYAIFEDKIKVGLQGYPDSLIPFSDISINIKKRFENNKILFIGYIDNRKGLDILIEAFIKINSFSDYNKYILDIIGTGEKLDFYKNKYSMYDNIIFHGYKDGLEKFIFINNSKFFVLPSYSDPWGWVVNEATSLKVPTIVSDAVMAKEILINDSFIFNAGSSDNLFIKLTKLLNLNYLEYEKISETMYCRSRMHTLEKSITSFLEIIKELKC